MKKVLTKHCAGKCTWPRICSEACINGRTGKSIKQKTHISPFCPIYSLYKWKVFEQPKFLPAVERTCQEILVYNKCRTCSYLFMKVLFPYSYFLKKYLCVYPHVKWVVRIYTKFILQLSKALLYSCLIPT